MSWWDYGYQITAMANRTILVDNNTWNNTHISRVGQVQNVNNISNSALVLMMATAETVCSYISFSGNVVARGESLRNYERT